MMIFESLCYSYFMFTVIPIHGMRDIKFVPQLY